MALGTWHGTATRCYRGRVVGSGLDVNHGGRSRRQQNWPLAKGDRLSRFAWDLTGSLTVQPFPCRSRGSPGPHGSNWSPSHPLE